MQKAMLKERKGTLILMALLAIVLCWAMVQIFAVPAYFQRVYAAPQVEQPEDGSAATNSGLRDAREEAEQVTATLEGACEHATLYAVGQPAAVSVEDGDSVSARLLGIEQSYFGLHELSLYGGRLIYPDEFLYGERIALVDEQLAVALFRYAEPLNEELLIAGQSYRIVGIVRSTKRVGDEMEYGLYVPLRALEKGATQLTSLVYEASPLKGAGGWSAFESATATLGDSGTTISLSKERMNAYMPLRLLLIVCGAVVGLLFVRLLNKRFMALVERIKQMLRDKYATSLLWWGAWRFALLAVGYAACIFVLAQLFVWLVDPVYTFPEWVPAVLVEPSDIQAAFWNVWQKPATVMEWRTPELLRLRFFRELLGWLCGGMALLAGSMWGRLTSGISRAKKKMGDGDLDGE